MKVYQGIKGLLPAASTAFRLNNTSKWGKIGLTLAVAMALQSCFKTPEARLPAKLPVKVFNITNERPAIRVMGVYYNPNNFGFTFTGGELDLKLGTFTLGHVKLDTVMTIPAHATFTIPVVVEPDFAKLGNSGLNLADSVLVSFSGTMSGKVGWFSKKIDIKYQGTHMVDISF